MGNDIFIGWNRYFPAVFILNDAALDVMDRIKNNQPLEINEEIEHYVREFKKYKFLYEIGSNSDPYRENFVRMVREEVEKPDRDARDFYRLKKDYAELKIVTDDCNLACAYCVNNYGRSSAGIKKKDQEKLEIIHSCIDQFMSGKIKNGVREARIFFNGGEILVEWELIKEIVQRIAGKYRNIKVDYGMNTNLTLLTGEMAKFFNRYNFKLHISIDGYREAHNRTRTYHNGRGSFDDVIEKVEIYRRYNKKKGLKNFQGTIEFPDDFEPEEVYKMEQYGFTSARLAPNLLNCTEEDARKKARLMGRFLELNAFHQFQVTESVFTRLKDKINQQEYRFTFNCQGLSALHRMGIELNLSTLSLSHLCGFAPKAALPAEELGYDIYNPKLWEVSYEFIKGRMESVLKNCMECELVGICLGGCIMSGLDNENRLNKAACAYQEEMWNIYVKKAYEDSRKEV
jgi:sulfatase maturation enzyme AslB (radical SAM superfamily)